VGSSKFNLNLSAFKLFERLCKNAQEYSVLVEKTKCGATLVDAGLEAKGGFFAGEIITEICLGGLGQVKIFPVKYEDVVLPSVYVQTDHPALSTLGSQFAGWQVKAEGYSASS
jgi:methenyltetrahydromethanopterin cyclohydrolase